MATRKPQPAQAKENAGLGPIFVKMMLPTEQNATRPDVATRNWFMNRLKNGSVMVTYLKVYQTHHQSITKMRDGTIQHGVGMPTAYCTC